MERKPRVVEVTVISGEDLRLTRRQHVRKNAYVTVHNDISNMQYSTSLDNQGGGFPAWNEKLMIEMPMHARHLIVSVRCKNYSGSKLIGTAGIPVTDFTGGNIPENYLHFLSYRLREEDGEKNGIINLSVRVCSPENTDCAPSYQQPITGAPVGVKFHSGFVTGIPVWSK